MLKEFKTFAIRGNVIDLAVGVVIGTAFGKIVSSFVGDIMMPLINPFIPSGDWKSAIIWPGIKIGSFAGSVVDFFIVAFFIFLFVKLIGKVSKKDKEKVVIEPTTQERLLMEIRDLLKQKNS